MKTRTALRFQGMKTRKRHPRSVPGRGGVCDCRPGYFLVTAMIPASSLLSSLSSSLPRPMWVLLAVAVWMLACCPSCAGNGNGNSYVESVSHVKVFHYILPHWGESFHGVVPCPFTEFTCEWTYSDQIKHLKYNLVHTVHDEGLYDKGTATVAVYNIHSWWERARNHFPDNCELYTNLTMAESQESTVRYGYLFDGTFKNFDATSTTSPFSTVQRTYSDAFLNSSQFIPAKYVSVRRNCRHLEFILHVYYAATSVV
jgi:hypothetical protein